MTKGKKQKKVEKKTDESKFIETNFEAITVTDKDGNEVDLKG